LNVDKENWLASRFGSFISASGRPIPYSRDSDTFRCVMLITISTGEPSYCIELKVISVVTHSIDLSQLWCFVCLWKRHQLHCVCNAIPDWRL